MSTITFKNTSAAVVDCKAIGLGKVEPDATIEIPVALAAPTRKDNGQRGLSAVEKCVPQLRPVDEAIFEAWQAVPPPPEPKSLIVTSTRREADEPAGVKALRDAAASAAAKASSGPVKASKAGPEAAKAGA
jgi:hypothetical protein